MPEQNDLAIEYDFQADHKGNVVYDLISETCNIVPADKIANR